MASEDNNPSQVQQLSETLSPELNLTAGQETTEPSSSTTPSISAAGKKPETSGHPQPEIATEYQLKEIKWSIPNVGVRQLKIILQNENGPCSLLAMCNVLQLRGDIEIKPFDRPTITYDCLVELLGDYLIRTMPETTSTPLTPTPGTMKSGDMAADSARNRLLSYRHNLTTTLSTLPFLQRGLDVNIGFDSIYSFEPTAELAVFDSFNIPLVHGWLVDPTEDEGKTWRVLVDRCKTYNGAVECVIKGSEVGGLQFLDDGTVLSPTGEVHAPKADVLALNASGDLAQYGNGEGSSHDAANTDKDRIIAEALVASRFLRCTATQLTENGLLQLSIELPDNHFGVLFRNNHFSTLYKKSGSELYLLVTDAGFADEPHVVWESLSDIDQGGSQFLNSFFEPASGGNATHVQQQSETATAMLHPDALAAQMHELNMNGTTSPTFDGDYALALSLQQQEHENDRRQQQDARVAQENFKRDAQYPQEANKQEGPVREPLTQRLRNATSSTSTSLPASALPISSSATSTKKKSDCHIM